MQIANAVIERIHVRVRLRTTLFTLESPYPTKYPSTELSFDYVLYAYGIVRRVLMYYIINQNPCCVCVSYYSFSYTSGVRCHDFFRCFHFIS